MSTHETNDILIDFFSAVPAFSFVLISQEGCALGPTVISAVELLHDAYSGVGFDGPYPESDFVEEKAKAARQSKKIIAAVQERVEQLRQSGVSFVLVWQAYGEKKPHLMFSADYDGAAARDLLVDFVQQEIAERICY